MKLSRKQAATLTGTVLAIFVLLVIFFYQFVRQNIVIPLAYMTWLGNILLDAVPQGVCLVVLVFFGVVVALLGLGKFKLGAFPDFRRPARYGEPSRYRYWLRRCAYLDSSSFFADNFSFELRRFLVAILADQEHLPAWEIEKRIVDGTLEVPPQVREFVRTRGLQGKSSGQPHLPEWWLRLNARLRPRLPADESSTALSQAEAVVNFIEGRLASRENSKM